MVTRKILMNAFAFGVRTKKKNYLMVNKAKLEWQFKPNLSQQTILLAYSKVVFLERLSTLILISL